MGNGEVLVGNDATGNLLLPLQLLSQGRLTFTEEDSPHMFLYDLQLPARRTSVRFRSWSDVLEGKSMLQ
jgi:hypothetical protein